MKRFAMVAVLASVGIFSLGRVALSDETKCCEAKEVKAPGFEKLKKLVGEWRMKGAEGTDAVQMTWALTAGGSALMETHMPGTAKSMVTLYHADGDKLVLTHYCAMNNQPRMQASKVGDKEIVFEFRDATNLGKGEPHMHALTITFVDDKHVKEDWTLETPEGAKHHVMEWERSK